MIRTLLAIALMAFPICAFAAEQGQPDPTDQDYVAAAAVDMNNQMSRALVAARAETMKAQAELAKTTRLLEQARNEIAALKGSANGPVKSETR